MPKIASEMASATGRILRERFESLIGDGSKNVLGLGRDGMETSEVLAHRLFNRTVQLHGDVSHLSAEVDGLANKIEAIKKIATDTIDQKWWVDTWNGMRNNSSFGSRVDFLRRRWNHDQGFLWSIENAARAPNKNLSVPKALPTLEAGDLMISEEAAKSVVGRLNDLQTMHANLSSNKAGLSAKLDEVKGILDQWHSNDAWYINDWNRRTKGEWKSEQDSVLYKLWDDADGFRKKLATALGL